MISRRRFLINGGHLGAWVIAGDLAGRIARLAAEKRLPYLVQVERPTVELWANTSADGYIFTLGCPGATDNIHKALQQRSKSQEQPPSGAKYQSDKTARSGVDGSFMEYIAKQRGLSPDEVREAIGGL